MHHTRRRTLIALTSFAAYRKPGTRDDTGGGTGDPNPGGGGGNTGTTGTGDGGDGGQGAGDKTPKFTGEFDPDRAARALAAAREGETRAKAEAKAERERVAAILKAAGLTADGKTDPETQLKELQTRAEQAETRARQLATRESVRTAAGKNGANADALLDSVEFTNKVAALDASKADFDDKVAELVKEAAKQDRYKAAPTGPAKSGAEITGGTSDGKQITADQLAQMSPEAIDKALREGRLAHLL